MKSSQLTLAAILIAGSAQTLPAERVFEVCEVLSDRSAHHGKMLKIRGIVKGNSHGAWLVDRRLNPCRNAPSYFKLYGIHLAPPSQSIEGVGFEYDGEAARRVEDIARRNHIGSELVVTYEGQFETRPDSELLFAGSDKKVTAVYGFGQGSVLPAQLIIKSQGSAEFTNRPRKAPRRGNL